MASYKLNLDEFTTIESLLKSIDDRSGQASEFEVLVPSRMTLQGRLICNTFPEAVVLDRLLQKGFVPSGGQRQGDGMLFHFGRNTPLDTSTLKTEPPSIDITQLVPALAPLRKTTIRLHPRRKIVSDLAASKLGGTFLWPASEPWPRCDDLRHQSGIGRRSATDCIHPLLVGVIQLNASDFPEILFQPGSDLLQILWCPTTEDVHDDYYLFPKLFVYWRNSKTVSDPIATYPLPDFVENINNHFPILAVFILKRASSCQGQLGYMNYPTTMKSTGC